MVDFKLILTFMVLSVSMVQAQIRGCYYQNEARTRTGPGKFTDSAKYKAGLCSHVFYAFAQVANGADPGLTGPSGGYPIVKAFKQRNPSLKLLISIGGANEASNSYFRTLVNGGQAYIQKFAQNAVAYAKNNGFDGIDVDWEYPANANERNGLTAILKALRSAGGSSFLVTIAVWPGIDAAKTGFDLPAIKDVVNFMNVMTYDYASAEWGEPRRTNPLAPIATGPYGGISATIDYYLGQGVPSSKLILGIPTYGRGWTLAGSAGNQGFGAPAGNPPTSNPGPINKETGVMSQYELCKLSGSKTYDSASSTAYRQSGNQWFSYEDGQSVTAKINYVKSKKLGGAFIWSIDRDDFSNYCQTGVYPIMNMINKQLIGQTFT